MLTPLLSAHSAQYTNGPRSTATNPLSSFTWLLATTVLGCMSKDMAILSPFLMFLRHTYPCGFIVASTFLPLRVILQGVLLLSANLYRSLGTTSLRIHPGIRIIILALLFLLLATLIFIFPSQGYAVVV